jgi:hypothetical protein
VGWRYGLLVAESVVSLQVAILKVLSGQPGGRASISDLNSDLAVLGASGLDWTQRIKRMAARVPRIDIFGQGLVIRDSGGWQLTEEGRRMVQVMDAIGPHLAVATPERAPVNPASRTKFVEDRRGKSLR